MTLDSSEQSSHSPLVRITHWIMTASFLALVVSGVAILIAHPRLYWGDVGNLETPAWIVLPIARNLHNSGWGRSLHFLAAWVMVINGVIYVACGLAGGHFRRNLLPKRGEISLGNLLRETGDHLRMRIPAGTGGPRYGALQKITYLTVIFISLPLIILTGLTMSPAITAAFPALYWIFAGRQSARTLHFLGAIALVIFLAAHIIMVIKSGFRQQMRAMTIGKEQTQ